MHCSIQLLVKTKNVSSFSSLHKNWMNLLAKQIVLCSKSASLLPSRGHLRNNMLGAGEQEKWLSVVRTSMSVDCNVI